MVSNTVDDCLLRQIAQKIHEEKIEARPVSAGQWSLHFFQTFICYLFV